MENTLNTNETNPAATTKRTGRKPTNVIEILDKEFTIVDLVNINSAVKSPTIRMFVTRNVESGRYTKVGTIKGGKRGKPATLFRLNKTA
jgi:hypothetical protein